MSRHTLSVLVEDKPGVLTRVAGLFARRAFNIHSLAVGPTELSGISRITVVVDADGELLEQVTKQLNKLINVIKIVELTAESSVQREHIMVKVRADASTRLQVTQAADLFRARIVDVSTDLIDIDLHLLHEVTSPQAFEGLRLAGRGLRRTDLTIATEDHNTPTENIFSTIADETSRKQIETLRRNCEEFGGSVGPDPGR